MLMYLESYFQIPSENAFFAGANTPRGFVCDYADIYCEDSFEKVYMLKGGSGTGKSTFIRMLCESLKKTDAKITYLLCSSDPSSLDGAVIERADQRIALVDATAPHICDPLYWGACGEIIDLGRFCNSKLLEGKKDTVKALVKEKSKAYALAYKYIRAAGEIRDAQKQMSYTYYDKKKARDAAIRLCSKLKLQNNKNTAQGVRYRRTHAISVKGCVRLTTFERAERLLAVEECANLSVLFFKELLDVLLSKGIGVTVSLCPFGEVCELYIEGADTAIVPSINCNDSVQRVNLRRFADKKGLSDTKQRRIFSSKCLGAMLEGADEALKRAGKAHFALEEEYSCAVDFGAIDREREGLCSELIKRLS